MDPDEPGPQLLDSRREILGFLVGCGVVGHERRVAKPSSGSDPASRTPEAEKARVRPHNVRALGLTQH